MGLGSAAPRTMMPYSVSMPRTFTMATRPTLPRFGAFVGPTWVATGHGPGLLAAACRVAAGHGPVMAPAPLPGARLRPGPRAGPAPGLPSGRGPRPTGGRRPQRYWPVATLSMERPPLVWSPWDMIVRM